MLSLVGVVYPAGGASQRSTPGRGARSMLRRAGARQLRKTGNQKTAPIPSNFNWPAKKTMKKKFNALVTKRRTHRVGLDGSKRKAGTHFARGVRNGSTSWQQKARRPIVASSCCATAKPRAVDRQSCFALLTFSANVASKIKHVLRCPLSWRTSRSQHYKSETKMNRSEQILTCFLEAGRHPTTLARPSRRASLSVSVSERKRQSWWQCLLLG
mmetsp:Transcript_71508/g.190961  ORF Transcript_71508/g.190961 Transcript_71508/m.190961 type:complete len:213 (-) Transcript_71508:271-909(-)